MSHGSAVNLFGASCVPSAGAAGRRLPLGERRARTAGPQRPARTEAARSPPPPTLQRPPPPTLTPQLQLKL